VLQTVLFVDDDPSLLAAFRRVFHREPFRLVVAEDTAAARAVLAREIVDVLVCDYMMPGVSGTDFLAEVRITYPEVIPIMLTGTSDVKVAADAIAFAGVFRFFTKPCDPAQLVVAIRTALQQKEAIRESRRLLRHALPDVLGSHLPTGTWRQPEAEDGARTIEVDDAPVDLDALLRAAEAAVDAEAARRARG
jgi:DNA-binding NtrC family response regulator